MHESEYTSSWEIFFIENNPYEDHLVDSSKLAVYLDA